MVRSEIVLVTGAVGFIGSHTCEKLLSEDYEVIGVDNLNDYYDQNLKKFNLKQLKTNPLFHFYKEDIRDYNRLSSLFKNKSIHSVIHLASQAGVRYSIKNPFLYQEVNVAGTLNLLELARHLECNNFIFASSSSVYGNQKKIPFSEDDQITHPISVYAATKQAGEALCHTYNHLYNMNINCLRLFTVYGPRGRPDMSPSIFTSKILRQEKVSLFKNPKSVIKRDFTYVSDIVEGIIKGNSYKKGFQIFNLGFGSPIKIEDFVSTLEKIIGNSVNIEYTKHQPGDVDITHADISKAKKELGYSPEVPLRKGLEMFVDWFKQYYNL